MSSKQSSNEKKSLKKKSAIQSFLTWSIFLVIILLFIFLSKYTSRTVSNIKGAIGNTACNLYNGGTFCLYDDTIYFSNTLDDGALYSMTTSLDGFKLVHNDRPGYLNATSHYLVYARMNYKREAGSLNFFDFTSSGLFRIDRKDGHNLKMIYINAVGLVSLSGNDIFYQHYDSTDGIDLYRASLNCKNNEMILDNTLIPAIGQDGIIYYSGTTQNHYIYSLNPDTNMDTLIYQGNCYQPARIGDSIYFLSLSENYSIARIDSHGGNPTLLVQSHCSAYNVDEQENYLVYQVDDGAKSCLEVLDLNTLETTTIMDGNYNNIHILGNLVFFQKFNSNNQYYFYLGDTSATLFQPEVIEK